MASRPTPSPLGDRLDALSITVEEAATIARLPLADVEAMVAGDAPVPDVPFRWLADDHVAGLAVERMRNTYTRSLRGEGAEHVDIPYGGGHAGATGQVPK